MRVACLMAWSSPLLEGPRGSQKNFHQFKLSSCWKYGRRQNRVFNVGALFLWATEQEKAQSHGSHNQSSITQHNPPGTTALQCLWETQTQRKNALTGSRQPFPEHCSFCWVRAVICPATNFTSLAILQVRFSQGSLAPEGTSTSAWTASTQT